MEERRELIKRRKRRERTLLLINMAEMVLSIIVMELGAAYDVPGLVLIGFGLLGTSGMSFMHHSM